MSDAWAGGHKSPLLDEAMSRLGKKDRDAVILHYFKEKNFGEVGAALKVTEAAAQRRVHRALGKLHHYFNGRGVILTTAVIAGEMSAHSIHAAPMALAKTVVAVAVVGGPMATASTLTLVKGTLNVMIWMKVKTAIVIGTGMLLLAGATWSQVRDSKDGWSGLDRTAPQSTTLPAKYSTTNGIGSATLKGVSVSETLKLYSAWSDMKLVIEPGVTNQPFHINFTYQGTSRKEAAKMLEQALRQQAGVVIRSLDDQRASVTAVTTGMPTPAPSDLLHTDLISLSAGDVDPTTVRVITKPTNAWSNLVFKFRGKTSSEIQAIVGSDAQIMRDGVMVTKTDGGSGGYRKGTNYIGLVLMFSKYDQAKLAEQALRGN